MFSPRAPFSEGPEDSDIELYRIGVAFPARYRIGLGLVS
jgi:hypothetical protein